MKTNEESVKNLQTEVGTVKATMVEQSREIEHLRIELNEAQQYSRRCNMEVQGPPFVHGEDLMEVMKDLSVKFAIPSFQSPDILVIHRLARKRDSAPTVLVNFASVSIKGVWMAARGKTAQVVSI